MFENEWNGLLVLFKEMYNLPLEIYFAFYIE